MKIKELKLKSINELQAMLGEMRDQKREMKFKVAYRQLKNVREMRRAKKIIAQILTLLKEKSKFNENIKDEKK